MQRPRARLCYDCIFSYMKAVSVISLGQMNRANVIERSELGWLLQVEQDEQLLLLPSTAAPAEIEPGQSLHVFVYRDGKGEWLAGICLVIVASAYTCRHWISGLW